MTEEEIEETLEILTIEEMHKMTLKELREYQSKLYHHRMDLSSIMEYRERIGDENNPYLLEAKNVVVEESE
tara:strand:- start:3808 stop:4020 length:213 start_codon:yes stop_codon:yes gene_type:complete